MRLTTNAQSAAATQPLPVVEVDPDDPLLTTPLARYNAMLAVLRNTLYMSVSSSAKIICLTCSHSYGGIYERGKREYTLDDFYSIQLDKMERYTCLKESGIVIADEDDDSSSEDDDEDDDEDEDDEDEDEEGDENDKDLSHEVDAPAAADDAEAVPTAEPTAEEQVSAAHQSWQYFDIVPRSLFV